MSEDRHSLSQPRPVMNASSSCEGGGSLLAWEVDVYRTGVDTPVDTLMIDDVSLPPRTNKKGKVVWRLPTEEGKLPNFGTDERRRILELFKERKKSRRKKGGNKQSSSSTSSSSSLKLSSSSTSDNGNSNAAAAAAEKSSNVNVATKKEKEKDILEKATKEKEILEKGSQQNGSSHAAKEKKTRVTAAAALAARQKKKNAAALAAFSATHTPQPQPSTQTLPLDNNKTPTETATQSHQQQQQQQQPPGFQNSSDSKLQTSNLNEPSQTTQTSQNQNSQQQSKYIIIPQHERPPPLPNNSTLPSLAVPAAKQFVDLYYPLITHGLSTDLAMHYTPHAQKSVSVGGAHSVVTGRDAITMQIASLSGATFVVRGVVAQDTADQQGAHILVTGLVRMALLSSSPNNAILQQTTMAPFAHSISLVPATLTQHSQPQLSQQQHHSYAFQIHNDALSLLTAEAEITANAHQQAVHTSQPTMHSHHHQQQQQQQQGAHPPPPGLFR